MFNLTLRGIAILPYKLKLDCLFCVIVSYGEGTNGAVCRTTVLEAKLLERAA